MTANSKNKLGPVALFCDFGLPYTGQMKAAVLREAPEISIIDLMVDAPAFDIGASSILLASMAEHFPTGTIFICVVDPDVGTDARLPGAVMAGGRWFVGPLNGIFEHTIRRWPEGVEIYTINQPAKNVSASFHGRDIFSPVAAKLQRKGGALKEMTAVTPVGMGNFRHPEFADDLGQVIYIDGFGNAITGVHAPAGHAKNPPIVSVDGRDVPWAKTFGEVNPGEPFAYVNSINLVELAVNKGRADGVLGLSAGSQVSVRWL